MFVTDGVMFVTDSVMFVTDGVMGWRVTLQLNDVASDLGIRKIGNDLLPSSSGVSYGDSVFLLNDFILDDGVLFAFSAFFRHDTRVRLQVWRPQDSALGPGQNQPFQLIAELAVIPSLQNAREDVSWIRKYTCTCGLCIKWFLR